MKLSFKKFLKKAIDDYKKSQSAEEIRKRIEKERLLRELDEEKKKRRDLQKDKYKYKIGGM